MPIAGLTSDQIIRDARADFETMFEDVLAGGPQGVSSLMTMERPVTGRAMRVGAFTGFPRPVVWDGPREITDMRAQGQSYDLKTYQAAVKIKRLDLEADGDLDIAGMFGDFFASASTWDDDILFTDLVANAHISYDGQPLLSDSHPFAGSGGGDNLTTNAFSAGEMNAIITTMRGRTDEDGRLLGIRPSHILCGPALEEAVIAATAADRAVFVDADGNINTGTAGEGGSVVIPGLQARPGRLTPVVSEWITGNQFFVMDLTKRSKPFVKGERGAPVQAIVDGAEDGVVFLGDEYYYGLRWDVVFAGGPWQLIHGRTAA